MVDHLGCKLINTNRMLIILLTKYHKHQNCQKNDFALFLVLHCQNSAKTVFLDFYGEFGLLKSWCAFRE
jgi:hypothetical protein